MATIKSYTDIEQSRKLAKILEVYTVDCYYPVTYIEESTNKYLMCYIKPYIGRLSEVEGSVDTRLYIPCWSLAALLGVIPEPDLVQNSEKTWLVRSWINTYHWSVGGYSNPVDACVAMILKLHELNLL